MIMRRRGKSERQVYEGPESKAKLGEATQSKAFNLHFALLRVKSSTQRQVRYKYNLNCCSF